MSDAKRFEALIAGLLDYDDEKIVHLFGAVREIHRHREPQPEDVRAVFDHLYGERKHLN